jgi:putative FmdB family regulatory protein
MSPALQYNLRQVLKEGIMPVYDYRCNACGRKSAFFYKSYKDYDEANAAGARVCPHCGSSDLVRVISRVTIAKPGRDYANMSSNEMLSVMEGGDSRELGQMMQQLGQD